MVWDSTGKTWKALKVPSQPAWVLLNADGTIKDSDLGDIPYDELLAP